MHPTVARPIAVYAGFIGKLPVAGMALANLHLMLGLRSLGYDVHYVERMNHPLDCYDPDSNAMTDDPGYAVRYLESLLPRFGFSPERFSFIDRMNRCHGSDWPALVEAIERADFVLSMGDATWFDELGQCERRAFIDADPMFTQVAMEPGPGHIDSIAAALANYPVLFTEGVRIGKPDCQMPSAGRVWIPTPPMISTDIWKPRPVQRDAAITSLMNWESGSEITYRGSSYGYKKRAFEPFLDLPRDSGRPFRLAVGGNAPRDRLRDNGWQLMNPLTATLSLESYQGFIAESRADFGVAKHAYVESRCGWFSDRSTCYLAAGRPVLHQDTGFTDWLPSGEGVLPFSNTDDVLAALEELDQDYERHAAAARALAEEFFEARVVLDRMLNAAGFR